MGVACVGSDVGKADHDVRKGQLFAGQLVHRRLEFLGAAAVHGHLIVPAPAVVGKARLIAGRMGDEDAPGRGRVRQVVHGIGAVVGKAEEGALVRIGQADAGVSSRLPDLLGRGELGVLVGDVLISLDAVGHMRMDRRVEVIFAADVQAGVVVHVDELGAEDALAVVVVQCIPGHEQLQELVAAGADGADLRDAVHIGIERAEAGDAALDLALDEQVGRTDAALRAGVLPLGIADVVDHDAHDAAVGAAGLAGQRVGVVGGQRAARGLRLFDARQRGRRQLRRCSGLAGRSRGAGRRGVRRRHAQHLFQPAGQAAAETCIPGGGAAGQGQPGRSQTCVTKYGPSRNFHQKKTSYRSGLCAHGTAGTIVNDT